MNVIGCRTLSHYSFNTLKNYVCVCVFVMFIANSFAHDMNDKQNHVLDKNRTNTQQTK